MPPNESYGWNGPEGGAQAGSGGGNGPGGDNVGNDGPSGYLPQTTTAPESQDLGVNENYKFDIPNVDTSIDPSKFASGPATELAPPEDIDAAQIGDYTPYTADDERTVGAESTVEGRLSGLLSQNNPYIERARLEGKQYANRSGMLNTSMGAGASMGAAIDRALPIAQQDARANLEQSFMNQGYSNEEAKHLADSTITRENLQAGLDQDTNQFNADRSFEADKINAAEQNKNNFATLTADLQGQLAGIDNELAMNLESLSREYAIVENLDTIQGAIYKELVAGMSTILANEPKVDVAKSKINNLIQAANIELSFSTGETGGGAGVGAGGAQTLPETPAPAPAPAPTPNNNGGGNGSGGSAVDGNGNSTGGNGTGGNNAGGDNDGQGGGSMGGDNDGSDGASNNGGGGGGGGDGGGAGSGGGGVSCFIAGTQVIRGDGSSDAIENIEIGDELQGINGSINIVKAFDRPLLWDRWLWTMNDEETPWFTSEHPFMTSEGWKALEPLKTAEEMPLLGATRMKAGDQIVQHDGSLKEMTKYAAFEGDYNRQLYNFILSNTSTYFADGNLVHNVK